MGIISTKNLSALLGVGSALLYVIYNGPWKGGGEFNPKSGKDLKDLDI
jgi:hypothetical protein